MLVIQNLIFFNIIFFIGRGLNIFFELYFTKNKKYEYFGIRKDYFYPIFTFFILGNLSFIINFFAPLQNNFLLIIISIFIGMVTLVPIIGYILIICGILIPSYVLYINYYKE